MSLCEPDPKGLAIENNSDNNDVIITGNNNNDNKNSQESKHKYVKVLVSYPFNNKDIILKVCKKQKGVYVWESLDGKHLYVGHSADFSQLNKFLFYAIYT